MMNRITLNIKDKKISENYEILFFSSQKYLVSIMLLVLALFGCYINLSKWIRNSFEMRLIYSGLALFTAFFCAFLVLKKPKFTFSLLMINTPLCLMYYNYYLFVRNFLSCKKKINILFLE